MAEENSNRFLFDAISALLLFLVAIGGAYIPKYLVKRGKARGVNERSLAFKLGNMLSAGVMLAAGFCHLLAEALPEIQKHVKKFPLGPFLCALGYVLTLVADEMAHAFSGGQDYGHGHGHGHGHSRGHLQHSSSNASELADNDDTENMKSADNLPQANNMHALEIDSAKLVDADHSDGHKHPTSPVPRVSFITAVLLGAALSLHSVLEGAALGAQQTVKSSEDIMLAIFAHKGLAAYALGASLMDSQATDKRFWCVVGAFSVASPFGIVLGYGISEIASGVISSSLSALASGTFLYVAMMEVIPKELADPKHKVHKILAMLVGFGAMSTLAIWA